MTFYEIINNVWACVINSAGVYFPTIKNKSLEEVGCCTGIENIPWAKGTEVR